jgi:hypothetical protein
MKNLCRTLCLLLLLTGCSKYDHDFELDERSFGRDTIRMIERDSGITLPADARGLNFFYKAPIDPAFAAKIEIPAGSRSNVLARLSELKMEQIHVSGPLGPRFKWWTPAQAKVVIERQEMRTEAYFHAILTEEGDRIILYLEWCVR